MLCYIVTAYNDNLICNSLNFVTPALRETLHVLLHVGVIL